MERQQYLTERWEMACHNLYCYSNNHLMLNSKKGYEMEFAAAKEDVRIVRELIEFEGFGNIFIEKG